MDGLVGVRRRFAALEKVLDERSRRLLVAAECSVWGPGGISAVSQATGISRPVIRQGLKELEQPAAHPDGRIRRPGGGRKKAKQKDPTLIVDLEKLVDSTTRGDPECCLRWTCKSVRKLAEELGRAAPYGVYDLAQNSGWVSVGVDHDTASFAVETIRRWWYAMGQEKYPQAQQLLITADGGGSNGSRVRLWKLELQKLADETGLAIAVSHFPPGTSKWNKIEHRLFSFISKNWRGQPLTSLKVIVSLIAGTTTRKGLRVHAEIDDRRYPAGIKVPDAEMAQIHLRRDDFHGEWNYEITPHTGIVIS